MKTRAIILSLSLTFGACGAASAQDLGLGGLLAPDSVLGTDSSLTGGDGSLGLAGATLELNQTLSGLTQGLTAGTPLQVNDRLFYTVGVFAPVVAGQLEGILTNEGEATSRLTNLPGIPLAFLSNASSSGLIENTLDGSIGLSDPGVLVLTTIDAVWPFEGFLVPPSELLAPGVVALGPVTDVLQETAPLLLQSLGGLTAVTELSPAESGGPTGAGLSLDTLPLPMDAFDAASLGTLLTGQALPAL